MPLNTAARIVLDLHKSVSDERKVEGREEECRKVESEKEEEEKLREEGNKRRQE